MKTASEKKDKVKSLAAYYTDRHIAKFIANLAIHSPFEKVADLSCGKGNLLIAASLRMQELSNLGKSQVSSESPLSQDLIGIDIDLQAAERTNACLNEITKSNRAFIAAIDATTLQLGNVVQGIDGKKLALEKVDTIIMNPPFLRCDRLSERQKYVLRENFVDYSLYFNGRSGLHAYFLFLADRFTLDSGRVAFVLPATVLRIQSTLGLRRFLLENYIIEHVVFGCETAAFSELAQFREVIVIAVKDKPRIDSRCIVSFLRKLPGSEEQANLFTSKLREFFSMSEDRYCDAYLSSQKVSQVELTQNISNVYSFLCGLDSDLPQLSEETRRIGFRKLVTIDYLVNSKKGNITRFDYVPSNRGAFVVQQSRVSLKVKRNANEWIVAKEKNSQVTIRNQLTPQTLTVERDCFAPGLRRTCRVDTIDVSKHADLVIIKPFKGIEAVTNATYLPKLRLYVDQRSSNLLLPRRIDVSSPGTRLLAFYSHEAIVGVDMWSIRGLPDSDAKIAALWFNSSMYLMTLLLNRTETTGAWLRLDSSTLCKMPIIDLEKLGSQEKSDLLEVFTSIQCVRFPSILEQLQNGFLPRRTIDRLFAKIIGYRDEETNDVLERLYPALINEIKKLRQLMFQGTKTQIL